MMTMSMKIIYKVCTERKFGHKKRATEAALFENKNKPVAYLNFKFVPLFIPTNPT